MSLLTCYLRLLSAAILLELGTALACSPMGDVYKEPLLETRVNYSDAVVAGIPISSTPDQVYDTAYSVEFQVYCVFKGNGIRQKIHIEKVGKIPGICITTNLTVDKRYIVFLRRAQAENTYIPTYTEEPAVKAYLDELPNVCAVTIELPEGMTQEDPRFKCPPPSELEECFPLSETRRPRPPTPPGVTLKTPPPPPKTSGTGPETSAPQPGQPHLESDTGKKTGVSYKPVVDDKTEDKKENDRDSATYHGWAWTQILLSLIFCLVLF